MNAHQLSKITTAARTPPVLAGSSTWKTSIHSAEEEKQDFEKLPDYSNEDDALERSQPEPRNFQPITNVERSNMQSLSLDRESLSAQFLDKIQELKNEHQKTLTLLNQFYETERSKSHGNRRRDINHLVPEYLDYTENNTLYHGNVPDRGPDAIPGYMKQKQRVKFDEEQSENTRDSEEVSSNADSVELVNQMWDNFSLDEYIERGNIRPPKERGTQRTRPRSAPAKKKEWAPVITIPKPFNMTLREEGKKEKLHTRSSMEVSMREQMRAEAEEQERLKTIRAREAPTHVYLPLYEEMCERRVQRSRFNKETSMAATMAMQKPFSFAERDARKLQEKKIRQMEKEEEELHRIKRRTYFEAQPVPFSVHDPTADDQRLEDALYRKIKAKLRSEDLMREAQYPPRMHSHEKVSKKRKEAWMREIEEETAPAFKPRLSSMPDFEELHRHGEAQAQVYYQPAETTVMKPFKFHSTARKSSRNVEIEPPDVSWGTSKPTPWQGPVKMPVFSDTLPTRMSDSARLRLSNMQKSIQEADDAIKKETKEEKARKERKRMLAMKVQEKAALNDPSFSQAVTNDERLKRYKQELRQRQNNYNKFLQDIKKKVEQRPLLIEQHDEKVAKQNAERRYNEILEKAGLSDDFVFKQSLKASSDYESYSPRDHASTNWSRTVEIDSAAESIERPTTSQKIIVGESNSSDEKSHREETKEKHVEFA